MSTQPSGINTKTTTGHPFALRRVATCLGVACAAFLGINAPAAAQVQDVLATPVVRNLEVALQQAVDDQAVILRGKIIRRLSHDKYLFAADGREIRIEIDRELRPLETVTAQTIVEIEGEFEKEFLESPEIDVWRITVLR